MLDPPELATVLARLGARGARAGHVHAHEHEHGEGEGA
ncbi:Uncharacterised protein [Mycobacteroides abscessus]|nr:Uncharacterised protein [Mycobacteroides abscessus]